MNVPIDDDLNEEIKIKIEKIMNDTNMFNKSNVDMVNLFFFYSINNTLEQYTKVVVPLKLGNLSKDELLTNILKYRINDGRRYSLNGIYAYQFDSDIIEFLKDNECMVKEHKQVEDIKFDPMIELFQHHSSIFIILNNEKTKHTKKIYESSTSTAVSKRKTSKMI